MTLTYKFLIFHNSYDVETRFYEIDTSISIFDIENMRKNAYSGIWEKRGYPPRAYEVHLSIMRKLGDKAKEVENVDETFFVPVLVEIYGGY